MILIKKIEFIKAVYDETLSHNIYSIANIEFKNFPPILGCLLYWNHSDDEHLPNSDDVKFYYEQTSNGYYTSVKFPKNNGLSLEERIELTRILLDERSEIGSYSIEADPSNHGQRFNIRKSFLKLDFPANFDVSLIPYTIRDNIEELNFDEISNKNSGVTKTFVEAYCKWRFNALKMHPEQFEPYLHAIDFAAVCYQSDKLSEAFLIRYLDDIEYKALQQNITVISHLSSYFIDQAKGKLSKELAIKNHFENYVEKHPNIGEAIGNDPEFASLMSFDEELLESDFFDEGLPYQHFKIDRGTNRWYGGEHLNKNIPSLASKQYDDYGFKRLTNAQMDKRIESLTEIQLEHFAAILEPHWLHRYRDKLNWSIICKENKYLTSTFLQAHLKYIDFEALGMNTTCHINAEFLSKYFNRFDHSISLPLFVRHLTLAFYLKHQDDLQIDERLFKTSYKTIPFDDYVTIATMLGYENDDDFE